MATAYLETYPPSPAVGLDPKVRAWLDSAPLPRPYREMEVADVRAFANQRFGSVPKLNEPVAHIEDREIPGPAGPIPVRVFVPQGRGPFPMLMFFHGGGWVLCNLDTHSDMCRTFAHRAGAVVVSVDYRLAPENKFPAAADDCYAALEWCAANAAEIGSDATRIAVAGDSAGGNLAASVSLMARDRRGPKLSLQLLIYPITNANIDTASYHQNASGYGLTRETMIYFLDSYLARPEDGANPYASPLRAPDLSGLAPALIVTAEYDPLRDDGIAYAARLAQAGVPVHGLNYLDMHHGFALWLADLESAKRAFDEMTTALRGAFLSAPADGSAARRG
jgi:acetyl esterase